VCTGSRQHLSETALQPFQITFSGYTLPVKVAIDIRRIADFGVGTYIRNILRAMGRRQSDDEFVLLGSPDQTHQVGNLPANFQAVKLSESDSSARGYFEFRGLLNRSGCDLVHLPYLVGIPQYLPCPYVVTVHDVLDHMYRTRNKSGLRRSFHFQCTRHVLRRAARIFAVSNFTKRDVETLFGITGNKIEVVYNAIDERFLRGHATEADRQFIAERYQVNYPFLLYAGKISPHKNVGRIIEAFSALKTQLSKEEKFTDLKLIIIGDELSRQPQLRRTVIRSAVQNDVRFLGFVPIDVLRIFYDTAKIFVFPSLYEGFGLPPLEAMSHGTPVVASKTTSLPEVVGNAAVLVNPENVFEIMRALYKVLLDQPLREKLKQRGYEQAARFSWDTTAARMLEVYREVATREPVKAPSSQVSTPVSAIDRANASQQ
jgi:glycosyltransferase involved in cell wall biosynthesis